MDPYRPGILQAPGGSAAGLSDPVGYLPGFGSGVMASVAPEQTTGGSKPVLTTVSGRQCLQFDGTDDYLHASGFTPLPTWADGLPKSQYFFAMVYVPGGGLPSNGAILQTNSPNPDARNYMRLTFETGNVYTVWRFDTTTTVGSYAISTVAPVTGWNFYEFEVTVTASGATGVTITERINGSVSRSGTANATFGTTGDTDHETLTLGATYTGSFGGYSPAAVGRSGILRRLPTSGEQTSIRAWAEGLAYAA